MPGGPYHGSEGGGPSYFSDDGGHVGVRLELLSCFNRLQSNLTERKARPPVPGGLYHGSEGRGPSYFFDDEDVDRVMPFAAIGVAVRLV